MKTDIVPLVTTDLAKSPVISVGVPEEIVAEGEFVGNVTPFVMLVADKPIPEVTLVDKVMIW